MKYLGLMHYFPGLDIWQRNDEIFLSQGRYTMDILHIFGMVDYKSINTPMDSNFRKLHENETRSNLVDPYYTMGFSSSVFLSVSREYIMCLMH